MKLGSEKRIDWRLNQRMLSNGRLSKIAASALLSINRICAANIYLNITETTQVCDILLYVLYT